MVLNLAAIGAASVHHVRAVAATGQMLQTLLPEVVVPLMHMVITGEPTSAHLVNSIQMLMANQVRIRAHTVVLVLLLPVDPVMVSGETENISQVQQIHVSSASSSAYRTTLRNNRPASTFPTTMISQWRLPAMTCLSPLRSSPTRL